MPARGTRPTTDRVRESLFNVLTARLDFEGVAVLDLYAGSGALGLEAISRGAASALFVESDRRAAAVIADNIAALGASGATVRCAPVANVVAAGADRSVDLVLADPPYGVPNTEVEDVIAMLATHGWLVPDAFAVIERPAATAPLSWPAGWTTLRSRRYGDTSVELAEWSG